MSMRYPSKLAKKSLARASSAKRLKNQGSLAAPARSEASQLRDGALAGAEPSGVEGEGAQLEVRRLVGDGEPGGPVVVLAASEPPKEFRQENRLAVGSRKGPLGEALLLRGRAGQYGHGKRPAAEPLGEK